MAGLWAGLSFGCPIRDVAAMSDEPKPDRGRAPRALQPDPERAVEILEVAIADAISDDHERSLEN
jgi:hypothetical protein